MKNILHNCIFTNTEKFLLYPLRELKDYNLKDFLKVQTNQQNDKMDFFNSHYLHHYRFIKKEKQKIKFIKAMYGHSPCKNLNRYFIFFEDQIWQNYDLKDSI